MKEATSFRLTPEAKQIIKSLAKQLGVNETSIVEIAVRELAENKRQGNTNTGDIPTMRKPILGKASDIKRG